MSLRSHMEATLFKGDKDLEISFTDIACIQTLWTPVRYLETAYLFEYQYSPATCWKARSQRQSVKDYHGKLGAGAGTEEQRPSAATGRWDPAGGQRSSSRRRRRESAPPLPPAKPRSRRFWAVSGRRTAPHSKGRVYLHNGLSQLQQPQT